MSGRTRTAVLISGRGSNLQALLDAAAREEYPAEIALVISNVPNAYGLVRASSRGVSTRTVPHGDYPTRDAFDAAIGEILHEFGIELVCLAGFMRILSDGFVRTWEGKLLNIHPSLLPAFKGANVHRRVLEAGVRISGCTVHYVLPELDSGPIIAQAAVPVLATDSEESLSARTLDAEHRLYPLALKLVAEKKVSLARGKAVWRGSPHASGELFSPAL